MALGEVGAVEAIDALLAFVDADSWLMRKHLADALGNLPSVKSQSALRFLMKDTSPHVAEAARFALARLEGEHNVGAMLG